jgi:hypothetical protein
MNRITIQMHSAVRNGIGIIIFIWVSVIPCMNASAQGCSDAGFCSVGNLRGNAQLAIPSGKHEFSMGFIYGLGMEEISTLTPVAEYMYHPAKRFSVQLKATAAYAVGELGSTFDPGDLFTLATYKLNDSAHTGWSLSLGIKIPLSDASARGDDGIYLPMDYQASLGTYDLIAGASCMFHRGYEINAGIQWPFADANNNGFYPYLYSDYDLSAFSPTGGFTRSPDALLRFSRSFDFKKGAMSIRPSILGIYHIGEDSYRNLNGANTDISGSSGLTLNISVASVMRAGTNGTVELILAAPVVVRETRPDGLTRSLVAGINYRFRSR